MQPTSSSDQSALNHNVLQVAGELESLLNAAEARMREECGDNFNEDIFIEITESLFTVFGIVVIDAVRIMEKGLIRVVRDEQGMMPFVYEVRSHIFSKHVYYIYPNVNYCQCDYFSNQVIKKESEFTCAHVLSIRFARMCNRIKDERVVNSSIMTAILNSAANLTDSPLESSLIDDSDMPECASQFTSQCSMSQTDEEIITCEPQ
ncbi:hypothetical protein Ddc_05840 [Ditylenchus destructor]|nr:hypothetical protein Ddc_05840 [Ditylenchus destructor]